MKRYLLKCDFNAPLGDLISGTSIPENYFLSTNSKLIMQDDRWVFEYNPFISIENNYDDIIDLGKILSSKNFAIENDLTLLPNRALCYCYALKIKCFLRHPRLYRYEDIIPNGGIIAIHTTPRQISTERAPLPQFILDYIVETYRNYTIYQIGGKQENKIKGFNVIDKTGLNWWDTAEIIAKSSIFIGASSGHIQIANCYPRVFKKVFLFNPIHDLEKFIPQYRGVGADWIDYNWQYYNLTENDIGITMSYLKI